MLEKQPGDDEARGLVMERANGKCERCQSAPPEHWHHVLTRGYRSIRHDLANGVALCRLCHDYAHSKPYGFRAWWRNRIGQDEWIRLRKTFTTKEWAHKASASNKERWNGVPARTVACAQCGKEYTTRGRLPTKVCSNRCRYLFSKRDPLRAKAITLAGSIRLGKGKGDTVVAMLRDAVDKPCTYCGKIITLETASIDHRTPLKGHYKTPFRRELDRRENLHVVCRKCNLAKGALTHEGFLRLLAFLRSDPELYAAIMPRLGLAGKAWQRLKGWGRG